LDPRTAFGALIVVNVICLGAGFTGLVLWARVVAATLPVVLLAAQRYWPAALVCAGATALALLTETAGLSWLAGRTPTNAWGYIVNVLLLGAWAVANLVARVLPAVLMGWYVITTMRVGELMGALGRWRLPRFLIIPLAVVLRMVPVLAAEATAIGQAARTRGLRVGLARPAALVDYRIVPLALRAIDISDELTQAGLTRGLEAHGARTCVGRIGFGWADAVVVVWAAVSIWLFVWGR
jgi:energy-coupling factor transport system permease protein